MGSIRDEATEAIIALDPQRSAESTLRMLVLHVAAVAAGLFRDVGDRLSLFASCGLTQVHLDRAYAAWDDGRESIRAGHSYTEVGFELVPIAEDAIVYVGTESASRVSLDPHLQQVAPLLLSALRETGSGQRPLVVNIEATPTADFDRERLLVLLERNEWNIARVARILDVERSTVYRRMTRWGIPRERVRKT